MGSQLSTILVWIKNRRDPHRNEWYRLLHEKSRFAVRNASFSKKKTIGFDRLGWVTTAGTIVDRWIAQWIGNLNQHGVCLARCVCCSNRHWVELQLACQSVGNVQSNDNGRILSPALRFKKIQKEWHSAELVLELAPPNRQFWIGYIAGCLLCSPVNVQYVCVLANCWWIQASQANTGRWAAFTKRRIETHTQMHSQSARSSVSS